MFITQIIEGLERDIHGLRQKHSLGPEESLPGCTQSPRLGVSMTIGTAGGAAAGTSKFTGFRHVHRSDSMGSGKVVSGSVARKEAASVPASTSAAPTPTPGAAPDQAVSPPAYASSSGFVFPPSLLPPNVAMAMGNLGMGMGMGGLGMSMDFGYLQALVAHALPATAAMDSEQRLQQQRDLLRGYASFTSAHRDTTSAATAASASGLSSGSGGSQLGSTSHGSNSSSGTSRNGSSGDLTTYFAPSLENIKYAGDHHLKRHEQEQKQRWEQESVGGGGIVPEALLDCQPISTQGKKAVHISEGNGGVAAAAAAASAATAMKSARGLNSGNTSRCNSSDSEESASPSPAPPSQQQLPEAVRTSQMQMQQQPHLLSSSSTTTSLAVPVVHP